MKCNKGSDDALYGQRPTELHISHVDSKRHILDLYFGGESGLQRIWIYFPETWPLKEEKLMAGAD